MGERVGFLVIYGAIFLTACAENGLVPHPPPVVINVPLQRNEEVVCVESRIRLSLPVAFPLFSYARRTWTCDLRDRPPRV
jgi:hypothetical protein